jgi:hypothetical protein
MVEPTGYTVDTAQVPPNRQNAAAQLDSNINLMGAAGSGNKVEPGTVNLHYLSPLGSLGIKPAPTALYSEQIQSCGQSAPGRACTINGNSVPAP